MVRYLKDKRAVQVVRQFGCRRWKFTGEDFWAHAFMGAFEALNRCLQVIKEIFPVELKALNEVRVCPLRSDSKFE